jgi:hypothetical protein
MSSQPWTEPMAVTARRKWLRAAMRERVVGPEVIAELRRQRAQRVNVASTMAGDACIEQEAATS